MRIVGQIERILKTAGSIDVLQRYVQSSKPVIVEGLYNDWPAIHVWSPTYFRKEYGGTKIAYRESWSGVHPDLSIKDLTRVKPITGSMAEFLDLIGPCADPEERSRYCLTGDGQTTSLLTNGVIDRRFSDLLNDIAIPDLFSDLQELSSAGLWLSGPGVSSWLHYDSGGLHNLNVQVTGSKTVLLFSPEQLPYLYTFPVSSLRGANFSRINIEEPDDGMFPLYKSAQALAGNLEAGDALFLPAFWFHSFKSRGEFNSNVNFWWAPKCHRAVPATIRSSYAYIASACLRLQNGMIGNNAQSINMEKVSAAVIDCLEKQLIESHTAEFF